MNLISTWTCYNVFSKRERRAGSDLLYGTSETTNPIVFWRQNALDICQDENQRLSWLILGILNRGVSPQMKPAKGGTTYVLLEVGCDYVIIYWLVKAISEKNKWNWAFMAWVSKISSPFTHYFMHLSHWGLSATEELLFYLTMVHKHSLFNILHLEAPSHRMWAVTSYPGQIVEGIYTEHFLE